jgi:nickel-dependent lactate racemase
MPSFKIPYSTTFLDVEIPERNLAGVLESRVNEFASVLSEEESVQQALDNPIGSLKLEEMVRGKKTAVIVTSDHTRPVPSRITLPILLERMRAANPSIDIRILVATGYHRSMTEQELLDKFGPQVVEKEKILMHDSRDESALVRLGELPSGGELWLNRAAVETDLLIAEGFIEPHFFAGFSGGRKAILPGIAGYRTVLANHCARFIASPFALTGVLENNPIHADMLAAAERVSLAFILNVVINMQKKVIRAFAGHSVEAHSTGCEFLRELAQVTRAEADIVVTSNGGYPLDQNVYQAVKGMTSAEATCREGGVIIMASACNDGHGGQSFFDNLARASGPREILDRVANVPMEETVPDQWEFQILGRILDRFRVIVVTDRCDPDLIRAMHLEHASTLQAALDRAFQLKGKNAKVTVIPDGVAVIVAQGGRR